MSKILVVSDVHGRTFWLKAKELINEVDKVVFLGDYVDPYSYEGINRREAINQFKDIIQFAKDNPDKVVLLLGNHDVHYCFYVTRSSRYDQVHAEEIRKIFSENMDLFKLWYLQDGYLFSHAGITNSWLKTSLECTLEEFLKKSIYDVAPYLDDISYYRGGYCKTGSIIWSDVREYDRDETYYQVFGHTQIETPAITNKWACLDSKNCFLIDTETKNISAL